MRLLKHFLFFSLFLSVTTADQTVIESKRGTYYQASLGSQKEARRLFNEKAYQKAFYRYTDQVDFAGAIHDNDLIVDGLCGMARSALMLGDYYEAVFWAKESYRYKPNHNLATSIIAEASVHVSKTLETPFTKAEYGRHEGKSFVSSLTLEHIDKEQIKFDLFGVRIGGGMLPVIETGGEANGDLSGIFQKVGKHYQISHIDTDYIPDGSCHLTLSYEQNYTQIKLEGECPFGGAGLYAEGTYHLLKVLQDRDQE